MTGRFVSNFVVLLVGSATVTSEFAFQPRTAGWVALAAGAAVVLVAFWAFALRARGAVQRWLDVVAAAAAGWMIVASRCFRPHAGQWLILSAAMALAGFGAAGLVIRELAVVRMVRAATWRVDGAGPTVGRRDRVHVE